MPENTALQIAWGFCGSFCTLSKAIEAARQIAGQYPSFYPIVSRSVAKYTTRFGECGAFLKEIEGLSRKEVIQTVPEAEPLGPVIRPDAMIIAPCTGNTLAKLAAAITDSPVTMAAKAHLRNGKPLILGICTNDALSANLKNIGELIVRKNIYLVPLYQDDPEKKPNSLLCDFSKIPRTLEEALQGRQIQPIFVGQ